MRDRSAALVLVAGALVWLVLAGATLREAADPADPTAPVAYVEGGPR